MDNNTVFKVQRNCSIHYHIHNDDQNAQFQHSISLFSEEVFTLFFIHF